MFRHNNTQEIDINNIKISLIHISDFIRNKKLKNNRKEDIPFLNGFGQIIFEFISSLFKGGWDILKTDVNNKNLHKLIKKEFLSKVLVPSKEIKSNKALSLKLVEFTKLPSLNFLQDLLRRFWRNLNIMGRILLASKKSQQILLSHHIHKSH